MRLGVFVLSVLAILIATQYESHGEGLCNGYIAVWILHPVFERRIVARKYPSPMVGMIQHTAPTDANIRTTPMVDVFKTRPIKVFIEDTDAYGVMYNANYLRAFDRALHQSSFQEREDNEKDITKSSVEEGTLSKQFSAVLLHEGWSIVAVECIRYKRSPTLGGAFIISGSLMDATEYCEMWNLVMTSVDGATVYNEATGLRIAHPPSPHHNCTKQNYTTVWPLQQQSPLPLVIPQSLSSKKKSDTVTTCATDVFPTYRDEFDPHMPFHFPLTSLLRLFERARSNTLGGPDILRQLQKEDNILLVVTENRNLSSSMQSQLRPGQSVTVETTVIGRRSGTILDCYQIAFALSAHGERHMFGQGITTVLAINATTHRPVRSMPIWALERLSKEIAK